MNVKEFWKELNPIVKILTITGLILMIYGKVAYGLKIYFFWESFNIGYVLFIGSIGVVLFVELLIKIGFLKTYFRQGWRTAFHLFFAILLISVNLLFMFSDSLRAAKNELQNNEEIERIVGGINGFGWFTPGASSIITNSQGTFENAQYELLVKGNEEFIEVAVEISRTNNEPWEMKILKISR
jgi:hypothetical protein